MSEKRKLAAIMFTDIVGYTALMSKDEHKALEVLQRKRDTLKPLIAQYNGEFLKEIGDGTLSSFHSAVEAVTCAIEVQRSLKDEPDFKIRIGIHIGDVVIQKGDIFGDGVNIASRIEPLAAPGGICISEKVYDDVRNKSEIVTVLIGERELKNVGRPLKIYALTSEGLPAPVIDKHVTGDAKVEKTVQKHLKFPVLMSAAAIILIAASVFFWSTRTEDSNLVENRIVVAVFENETGDPELDQYGKLMGDCITQGLQNTGIIEVIEWPTALKASLYLSTVAESRRITDPFRALAEETRAGVVVSGQYYREGEELLIRTQVKDVYNDEQRGALDPVRGQLSAPTGAINQLCEKVLGYLAVVLDERLATSALIGYDPPNIEAYKEFNLGLEDYFNGRYSDADQHFSEAYAEDSTFVVALFYSAVSSSNGNMDRVRSLLPVLDKKRDQLSEYYCFMLDWLQAASKQNIEEAYSATRKAAELAPGSKAVYNYAAESLRWNRPQEAVTALLTLDPERGPMRGWSGYWLCLSRSHYMLGDYQLAYEAAQRGQQNYPDWTEYWNLQIWPLAAMNRIDDIHKVIDERIETSEGNPTFLMLNAALELRAHGYNDASRKMLDRAFEWFRIHPPSSPDDHHRLGLTYYYSDSLNVAQEICEKLIEENPDNITYQFFIGCISACLGNSEKAEEIINLINNQDPLGSGSLLWKARITAQLGKKEQAVDILKELFSRRFSYYGGFHRYIEFESLLDYKPFIDLLKPKG
ncbi:adenylate/guanylate cyclase domain-containing protein [candidate division KSB1 bacterium]